MALIGAPHMPAGVGTVIRLDINYPIRTRLPMTYEDVVLPREAFIRLVTWVDANAPYYGSYHGRRNIKYRTLPDFRPAPTMDVTKR